ncbi:hypothetical protein C8R41DRAFT_917363 [Lentinula lateritia]|uniref:Nephrocystin 3-like N-terminal domain-containing protein n=1 Tax=Lentinula lateritia TaxID=40482 RepID=A0ABQ8VQC1_9AGAR|nr:hypothetical protein C8R41DRAFT_917363 [Lentinula lateritia]
MASGFHCKACTHTWKRNSDLTQHYLKTQNPNCRKEAEAVIAKLRINGSSPRRDLLQRRPRRQSLPKPDATADQSTGLGEKPELEFEEAPTMSFLGDFFGQNYTAEDFPGFENEWEDEDDGDEEIVATEPQWEPERQWQTCQNSGNMAIDPPTNTSKATNSLLHHLPSHRDGIHIQKFGGRAGAPLPRSQLHHSGTSYNGFQQYQSSIADSHSNTWAPFASRTDWEVAHWAKMRGSGSTAFSDLLAIDGVIEALGLSYRNSNDLNNIIDNKIPSRQPSFTREEVIIAGQSFDLYKRDIIECIQALYGNPDHSQYLCFSPERHYADTDNTVHLYHDFNTGKWWWNTQKALEAEKPGATIIPIIISSDKTQEIRRKPSQQGQILLAYLPTSHLEHIKNKAGRCWTLANLFHACMKDLTSPLREAGLEGIIMSSGDGVRRRCHPILAAFVGDYPEQILVTTAYSGDCVTCDAEKEDLGIYPCVHPYRDIEAALEATHIPAPDLWVKKCLECNIKPVQHPFWADLPYTNIFASITPDILHQLYEGVMKHLISWVTDICSADEIDARVRRLPPNHTIRIFHKGISTLSRVSGTEHKQMCSFILGVITDIPHLSAHQSNTLLAATCALLDFLYLSCYPIHTTESLSQLDEALSRFHAHREVFVQLGYCYPNIPFNQIDDWARFVVLPFSSLPVWHKLKFNNTELFGSKTLDSVTVHPSSFKQTGQLMKSSRFDTVLVKLKHGTNWAKDTRVGRVRVIFSLPPDKLDTLIPSDIPPPQHLVYVTWFTKFTVNPEPATGLYWVKRDIESGGLCTASIVALDSIVCSAHLFPQWGGSVPPEWTSETVLDHAPSFLLNIFKDEHVNYYDMSKCKSDGFASASEAKKMATAHEPNSSLLSSSTSSKENRTLRRAGPHSSALPVSQVVSQMALDNEALKSLERERNEWMEEKRKLEQKESDIRQMQRAMEDFERQLNKGKCDIEQQDQELKEREAALKEHEMSLRERETSLWTEEAALAKKECEDVDALYKRWKCARDYHITTIENEKKMIVEWVSGSDTQHIFWLNGPPASGKSSIIAEVIKKFDPTTVTNLSRKVAVVDFLCTRVLVESGNANVIIPTLAYQLAEKDSRYRRNLLYYLESILNGGQSIRSVTTDWEPTKQLEELIVKLMSNSVLDIGKSGGKPNLVILVIDSLEECVPDQYAHNSVGMNLVINLLQGLGTGVKQVPNLKVIVSSRPTTVISSQLDGSNTSSSVVISYDMDRYLSSSDAEEDIRKFYEAELRTIQTQDASIDGRWPSPDVILRLVKQTGNSFLIAQTVCRMVGRADDPKETLNKFLDMPLKEFRSSGIQNIYTPILEQVVQGLAAGELDPFRKAIMTIVLLRRTMSVEDLAAILGVKAFGLQQSLRGVLSIMVVPAPFSHQKSIAVQ